MELPESVVVTDQEINLSHLTEIQKDYFLSLAAHIKDEYEKSDVRRYVVGISGPSGSGKSVLSFIVVALLENQKDVTCRAVDLDAFHYSSDELRDRDLLSVKGRYDTYNIEALAHALDAFKNDKEVVFPRYSREDHEPHADGPVVHAGNVILLLPGLWIQRNGEGWNSVRKYVDYTIAIKGSPEKFKQNTLERHIKGGRLPHDAEKFYSNSDYRNAQEIFQHSVPSDLTLPYYEDVKSSDDIPFG